VFSLVARTSTAGACFAARLINTFASTHVQPIVLFTGLYCAAFLRDWAKYEKILFAIIIMNVETKIELLCNAVCLCISFCVLVFMVTSKHSLHDANNTSNAVITVLCPIQTDT